jgi:choice-of-anchor C domain-containing protein
MKIKNLLFVVVALSISQSAIASPNLIVNGSFESSKSDFAGSFATYFAGSSELVGWTLGGDSVDHINTYWQAAEGNYSLDLSGNYDGSISQMINTNIGQIYHVSFSMAGNPDDTDKIKSMQVGLSNQPMYKFDATGAAHDQMNWTTKGFDFIATNTSSTLFFTSMQDSAYGVALDNISVTAVPEPETYAMFLTGIVLLAGITRRRKSLLE